MGVGQGGGAPAFSQPLRTRAVLVPHVTSPTHTPRLPHVLPFVRTRAPRPALKRVAAVSILGRWRGGRAANCTGLENRRVFTHVGSNPTPSAREQRSRRRGCDSNPGLRLRALRVLTSPSAPLRGPSVANPTPVAFLPLRSRSSTGRRDPTWAADGRTRGAALRVLGDEVPVGRAAIAWDAAAAWDVAVGVAIRQRFKEVQPWRSCDPLLSWWFSLP